MTSKHPEAGVTALIEPGQAPAKKATFRRSIGIRVDSAEAGVAQLSLELKPSHLQSRGAVHGGVYATLIDSAIANAIHSVRTDGRIGVTTDLSVNFLKGVQGGSLRAVAQIEHTGGTMMVGSCTVFSETGERVALGKATFFFR